MPPYLAALSARRRCIPVTGRKLLCLLKRSGAPQYPQRNLIATWGGWVMRGSKKDRA